MPRQARTPSRPLPVYCRLRRGQVHTVREFLDGVIVDRDRQGRVLGVEVLEVTELEVNGRRVMVCERGRQV